MLSGIPPTESVPLLLKHNDNNSIQCLRQEVLPMIPKQLTSFKEYRSENSRHHHHQHLTYLVLIASLLFAVLVLPAATRIAYTTTIGTPSSSFSKVDFDNPASKSSRSQSGQQLQQLQEQKLQPQTLGGNISPNLPIRQTNANPSRQFPLKYIKMAFAPDYEFRSEEFGFADPEEIEAALEDPKTVVLDVRTEQEIETDGRIHHENWRSTGCTPFECPQLAKDPTQFVSDDKDATILVYCKSGRRASKAVEVLQSHGYNNVLNAGGYADLQVILSQK